MNCSDMRPYLQAYVDDELSPERSISFAQHLVQCSECSAEVEITRSLRQATRTSVTAIAMCPEFRSRLCQCVGEERKRQEGSHFAPLSWRVIVPLASAAAFTLFISARYSVPDTLAAMFGQESPVSHDDSSLPDGGFTPEVAEATSQDGIVDFLIRHHASRFEPEVFDAKGVDFLEPRLGFRVNPPDLGRYGASFQGANLVPVNRTRAAVLHYMIGGKRVTLYMYNPEELHLRGQRELVPRVVGNRAVFVGERRGYTIATCESQGVGYAVTADLSGEESAELVAALDR